MIKGAYKSKGLDLKNEDPKFSPVFLFCGANLKIVSNLNRSFLMRRFWTGNVGMTGLSAVRA